MLCRRYILQLTARAVSTKMAAFQSPPELLLRTAVSSSRALSSSETAGGSYRAAVCTEWGKPLVIQNMPHEPKVDAGQVRVAVHSVGIQFADLLMAQGKYQVKIPVPFVPGSELAGEVLELGEGVSNLRVGDRVFGFSMNGALAEETIVPAEVLSPLPSSVDFPTGASFLTSYGTAYMALTRKANIKKGDTVLVTAAAGGFGMACVDLAVNVFKCKVIGAAGSAEKCALVKSKGAIECIDYTKESIRERVKEITGGDGADVILDAVGGKVFQEALRSIAFEGRIVVIGFTSGEIPKIAANYLLVKSASAVGVWWGNYMQRLPAAFMESVVACSTYLQEGKIHPHISQAFPLAKVNEAFQFITERKSTGKVIVNVRQ